MWTQKLKKLNDKLNLAHVARKNMEKKKLKQTNASAHLVQYRFLSHEITQYYLPPDASEHTPP